MTLVAFLFFIGGLGLGALVNHLSQGKDKAHWIVPTTNQPTYYLIKRRLGEVSPAMYLGPDDKWSSDSHGATKFDSREIAQKFLDDFLTE